MHAYKKNSLNSEIIFDVNLDWLEEAIIDGNRCIIINLDSIDAKNDCIKAPFQSYFYTIIVLGYFYFYL